MHVPQNDGVTDRFGQAMLLNSGSRLIRMGTQVTLIAALGAFLPTAHLAASLFILLITEVGTTIVTRTFTQSLISRGDKISDYERSAFFLNVSLSLFSTLISFFFIYTYVGRQQDIDHQFGLIYTALIISTAPIISSLTIIPQATFSLKMRFGPIALAETIATIVSTICAIAYAYAYRSYEAVIVYLIVQRLIELAILSLYRSPLPKFGSNFTTVGDHIRFSAPLIATFLVTSTVLSADQVFVSVFFDAEVFALYAFARRITDQPVRLLMHALERSVIPTLVSLKGDIFAYRKFIVKAFFLCALISGSIYIPAAILAKDVLFLLFPENLHASYIYVAIFCAQCAVLPIGSIFYSMLVSFGKTSEVLLFTCTRLFILLLISFGLAYALSLNSVQFAAMIALFNVFMLVPNFKLANREAGVSPLQSMKAVLRGLSPGLLSVACVLAVSFLSYQAGHAKLLVLQSAAALIALMVAVFFVARAEVDSFLASVRVRK